MATDNIQALEAAKAKISAKIARLEQKIAVQRQRQLAGLPGKHGFDSLEDFLDAVRQANGGKGRGRGRGRPAGAAGAPAEKKRRKRAVITDATREAVKKQAEAGKTGAAIAADLGISLPSVQNIKKALGLVKARKK